MGGVKNMVADATKAVVVAHYGSYGGTVGAHIEVNPCHFCKLMVSFWLCVF